MQEELIQQLTDTIARQSELLEAFQQTIKTLQQTVEAQNAELVALRKIVYGRKTEKIEPIDKSIRKKSNKSKEQKNEEAQAKRAKKREEKSKLPEIEVIHKVEENQLQCPVCGSDEFTEFPQGQESVEYEYIPPKLVKKRHIRQKMACTCGEHIAMAPNVERVTEGTHYGPGLHAHVAVQKCADSLPFYRQEKVMKRAGVPLNRSTLKDLFHRVAELLEPIYKRMKEVVAASEFANADETTIKMQKKGGCQTAWMWTFIAEKIFVFVFSTSRSGETPLDVLGGTQGKLQVDGYSGYNQVSLPEGRERVGCLAHVRRKFFEAKTSAPKAAQKALDFILELYEIEHKAVELEVFETEDHSFMRKYFGLEIMTKWKEWLLEEKDSEPPKSPMGQAINYTLNNWEYLLRIFDDVKIPLDNNISERSLRSIAVGRKNFLFVGNKRAGKNLAIVQSLVSTCEANEVNAQEYLADVLIRIQSHPMSDIDALLPQNWTSTQK